MKSLLSLLLFTPAIFAAEVCQEWETSAWYTENRGKSVFYYSPPVESSNGLCRVTVYESQDGCEAVNQQLLAAITSQACHTVSKDDFVSVQFIEDYSLKQLLNWLNNSFSGEVVTSNSDRTILVGELLGLSVGQSNRDLSKYVYLARYTVANSPDLLLEIEQNSSGFNIVFSGLFHVD